MGLFDTIKSKITEQVDAASGSSKMLQGAWELLQTQGGVEGIVQKFQAKGLGATVQSWVGSGPNQTISPEQIHSVFGENAIQNVAQKIGMSPENLTEKLSAILPKVVDHVTPNGQIPNQAITYEGLISAGVEHFFKKSV